jgi:hypothetical protein
MCSDAAYGQYLIEAIATSIGIDPDTEKIDRAVYNGTSCGAWVKFDEEGILVGTNIEGSDAEFSKRIELSDDEDVLCKRFWAAIQECEDFAEEHFEDDDDTY